MILLWIFIGILALLIIITIAGYNTLVVKRNRTRNAWHQIDVQLRRRYDLIPNIVETVKGYAKHERETLESVIAARKLGMDAKTVEDAAKANNMLTDTLKSLFAVAEAYPDLKANQNFMALQEELRTTEEKIAFARQFYNDATMEYNTATEKFPGIIFAGLFGFKRFEFWEIPEAETAAREPVKVSFD
jgi:LemA protein